MPLMLRFLTCLLFLGPLLLSAQKSVQARPEVFSPEKMRAQHIYQVNMFQTVRPQASTDPGSGRVMRVVGAPSRSYFFNSNGEVIRELQFNRENGRLQTEIRWQKGQASLLNGDQKTLTLRKDMRTYTYRSEDPADSLLALHQFVEYSYNQNGRIEWERTFEKDGPRIHKVDSTRYIYQRSSDRLLAHTTTRFFEGGKNEMVGYDHPEPNQLRWRSDLGRETNFTHSPTGQQLKVQILDKDVEHGWEHFYEEAELDSTSFYTRFADATKEPIQYGSRFFYDKSGKLVLVRLHLDTGEIEEELYEYLNK